MKKIDLSIYKDFKQYFIFYDIEIKKKYSNKEEYLDSKNISPSSYRRAKNAGNKIGKEILEKLNHEFSYKMINADIINQLEIKLNEIYYNIYYKKSCLYEENANWVEEQLKYRYMIQPILILFKLFLIVSSGSSPERIIEDNQLTYIELTKYVRFLNEELLEIYEIVDISFRSKIDDVYLSKKFKNELSCFTLSGKCLINEKYIESLYFAEKAKVILIKEENIKRLFHLNLNMMSAYNSLERYEDCYLLARKQMLALESYEYDNFEYKVATMHYLISCLGLGYYEKIIEKLSSKLKYNKTEIWCLLISKYNTNKKEYEKEYLSLSSLDYATSMDIQYLKLINNFLVKKDKKIIEFLEKDQINPCIISILKKM